MSGPHDSGPAGQGLDERGLPPGKRIRAGMEIGPIEARDLIAAAGARTEGAPVLVVDVREPDEWRICRIEGAVLVPLGEIEERADEVLEMVEDLIEERVHQRDAGSDIDAATAPVVVYCHHGVRSLTATALLQAKGLRGARSMAGGIDLWSVAVDPAVARY